MAASSWRMEQAVAAQAGTAIRKRGGNVSCSLPALCPARGASAGCVGCLRIRDLVVNPFPHPRPFHSCPWDQRSSALEPCMGTAPAREAAAEPHVRDGGRTSSCLALSCCLFPPAGVSRDPQQQHKSSQQSADGEVQSLCFQKGKKVMPSFTWPEFHMCLVPCSRLTATLEMLCSRRQNLGSNNLGSCDCQLWVYACRKCTKFL